MQLSSMFLVSAKLFLSTVLLFPFAAFAHLLSITATIPIPATVAASSNSSATFTVTNISTIPITPVDQSNFPSDSGLSVLVSTCDNLLLNPGDACTIELSLNALSVGKIVDTELKIWAQPSMDAVQHPIEFTVTGGVPNITITPISINSNLPKLRDPVLAEHAGKWLIVSGSLGKFHDFSNNFNTDIYVYDPNTQELDSVLISSTTLPVEVKNQLASSVPQFLQDGDTLYIIGGFYSSSPTNFTTLNTITSINVPGMINAITNNQDITPFVKTKTDPSLPQFKVTGGQLAKIGNYFYLAYGQDCEGFYCSGGQVYTNAIYKFITDPSLASTAIVDTVVDTTANSGWRRRDYFLAPFMSGNTETLLALAGPFQPGNPPRVWTNAIIFDENIEYNSHFISNQQGNQYLAPNVSMHSANYQMTYVASFSGLSNLYWTVNGLAYDNSTPYGNVLDLISAYATGDVREYVNLTPMCSGQPLANCLYMGLSTEFIRTGNYYDHRDILQLDQLPQNSPTLVGYLYAGLTTPDQDIFPPTGNTTVTNQVYAVYVTPAGSTNVTWQNVTNVFP